MKKTFTLLIALLALTVSAWATQVEWGSTELATLNLSMGNTDSQEFNGVTVSLSYQNQWEDNCYFNSSGFSMNNDGALVFASGSGILTSIVITCDAYNPPLEENSGWEWNSENSTLLRWTGSASSVFLKSNSSNYLSSGPISSIVFTISGTTITWESDDLESVNVRMEDGAIIENANSSQEVNGITITANAPAGSNSSTWVDEDDSSIHGTDLMLEGEGSLTFAPASGKLKKIVITCETAMEAGNINDENDEWSWDDNTSKLTWIGEATSVVMTPADPSYGFGFMNISSVKFTVVASSDPDPEPEPDPALSGPSFIWQERQVDHVDLQSISANETKTTPVIKNIITSLTRTGAYGQCKFTDKELYINSCGELTFKSIVGDIRGIIITCDSYNDVWASGIQPSEDWTYDSDAKTFTWTGTPSDEVTISGNVDFLISSIEFFYTPAPDPEYLGEQFWGDYNQLYEITGPHTAKLPAQTIDHTLNIPASVDFMGETYYVTEIDDYAFYNNEDLPNIMGGENIAKIGEHAFHGCLRMVEANFESKVIDNIGEAAFFNCKLMFSFMCETEFPPVLGSSVFTNDNYLNHIRVYTPDDYQSAPGWGTYYAGKIGDMYPTPAIGEQFFWRNQMTSNLYEVSSTDPREAKILPYNAEINAIYPITREGTLVIPEMADYMNFSYNITGIGANAYKNETDIDLVVMPLAMKSIESGAFLGCTGVEKVYFLWDDPTTVTWADANVGDEFKTATGGTKIFVPKGKLEVYQTWAPAWRDCMIEGDVVDAVATEDPDNHARYFRTFYDSSSDYMMPAGVWAHAGYVEGGSFMLSPVAFDGQILPRGTAVVLESDTRVYRLIPMGNDAPLYDGRNELVGTDENLEVSTLGTNSDKVYVLNTQATIGGDLHVGMGMYKYTGTTLGAHKAYLIYDAPSGPNSAPARFVFKHEQTTTDVENVQSDKVQCTKVIRDGQLIIIKDGKEYNAQGQKLR